jgi:hypothetical protein
MNVLSLPWIEDSKDSNTLKESTIIAVESSSGGYASKEYLKDPKSYQ